MGYADTGVEYGGPGSLIVQAGNHIDLGTAKGIMTVGDGDDPYLDSKGDLVVVSGYNLNMDVPGISSFFNLTALEVQYFSDLSAGDTAGVQDILSQARNSVIKPFLRTSGGR